MTSAVAEVGYPNQNEKLINIKLMSECNFNPNCASTPPRKPKKLQTDIRSPLSIDKKNRSINDNAQTTLKFTNTVSPDFDETLPMSFNLNETRSKSVSKAKTKNPRSRKNVASLSPKKSTRNLHQSTIENFVIKRTARLEAKAIIQNKEESIINCLRNEIEENMKIVITEEKGRGIINTKPIEEGQFVVEYAGELISEKDAKIREAEYKKDPSIGSYMFFFVHNGKKLCVDATAESGKFGRLLNHSRRNPNCALRVVPINDIPRLAIVAKRFISTGEELLYDYGDRDKESLIAHPWLAF